MSRIRRGCRCGEMVKEFVGNDQTAGSSDPIPTLQVHVDNSHPFARGRDYPVPLKHGGGHAIHDQDVQRRSQGRERSKRLLSPYIEHAGL